MTSHSRMSGSRWVITPSWLSGSWRSFLYSSSVYSCHLKHFLNECICIKTHVEVFSSFPLIHSIDSHANAPFQSTVNFKKKLIFTRASPSELFFSQCVVLFKVFIHSVNFAVAQRSAKTIPLDFWWLGSNCKEVSMTLQ